MRIPSLNPHTPFTASARAAKTRRFCAIAVAYCAPYAVFDCFSAFRGLLVTQTGGANTYPNLYRHSLSGGLVFEIALTLPGDKNAFSDAHFSTYTGILILAKIPHSVVCSIELR